MCGIGGVYCCKGNDVSKNEFDIFIDSMKHRGPDDRGTFKDPDVNLQLGHRRLSILDLSKEARQPMSYYNRFWISFNGEIYNFLEIKKELETLGYYFKTNSDTEVLLVAYIHWGKACQLKFNGMWAFAIWDTKKKEFFLSRDRFGVKPLFYFYDQQKFIFASEIKAFFTLKNIELSISDENVSKMIHLNRSLDETQHTPIKQIKRMKPGFCSTFSNEKGLQIERWWNTLDHLVQIPSSQEEQISQFKELFFNSCILRMRSDVPIANALSGGLDSSSVTSTIFNIRNNLHKNDLQRLSANWQNIFVALYPNTPLDEYKYAKEVVEDIKGNVNYCEITPTDIINNYEKILYQVEELFDVPIGPWKLYESMRKSNITVSLDGHGGDEQLGGYVSHMFLSIDKAFSQKTVDRKFVMEMRRSLKNAQGFLPPRYSFFNTIFNLMEHKSRTYPFLNKGLHYFHNKMVKIFNSFKHSKVSPNFRWLQSDVNFSSDYNDDMNHPAFQNMDILTQVLYLDFHYGSLPCILRNFDRCSMAHGVEIRAPLMDWRTVTYSFSLPQKMKINNGYTKVMLREAMKGVLVESIRKRKSKIGFCNPLVEWMQSSLKEFVLDSVSNRSFIESNIWNGKEIKKYTENCFKNNDSHGARRSWEYIMANHLVKIFNNKITS